MVLATPPGQNSLGGLEEAIALFWGLSIIVGLISAVSTKIKGEAYGGDGNGGQHTFFSIWFATTMGFFIVVGAIAAFVYIMVAG
jgi:hypothetical protein